MIDSFRAFGSSRSQSSRCPACWRYRSAQTRRQVERGELASGIYTVLVEEEERHVASSVIHVAYPGRGDGAQRRLRDVLPRKFGAR